MRRDPPGGGRREEPRTRLAVGASTWLLVALPLVLAALVHRRALGAFFSPDDFVRLEEAVGLLHQAPTLWRLVSEVFYVRWMLRLFGPHPLPFHLVSLTLHLVNTAFVFRTGRRVGLSTAAACFAATWFGAFPLFYTALLSAVNINDILALTFVFMALLALEAPSLLRSGIAVACFAVALLSKEAVLFVPFAAALFPAGGEGRRAAARRLSPLLVTGALFAVLYLLFHERGLGTGGSAYAVGFGLNLFHNLMTYAEWSVDLLRPVPDVHGMFDPSAWIVGLWPLLALALGAVVSRARRGVILFGGAWWLLALVPVLPLLSHTYGHYLYVPMAGFAIAGAGALEAAAAGVVRLRWRAPVSPASGPRAAGTARGAARSGAARSSRGSWRSPTVAAAFVVLAVAFAVRSEQLLRERASARLGTTALALDPFTRKMEVAEQAVSTLTGQLDRDRDSVVVYTPPVFGQPISANTGQVLPALPTGVPHYNVAQTVLGGGRALRLFVPRVDSIVFVDRWTPDYRGFDLFTLEEAGHLVRLGRGVRAHSRFAGAMLRNGYDTEARNYLSDVIRVYPGDRLTRFLYAVALARTGAPDSARANAVLLLEGGASDTLAVTARRLIAKLDAAK